ncbi:MAG: CdaR family protein [Deltaproteobacteria bacterium]|nr:CdaR family protein [Deltaproteobacteria bacterium]
MHKPQTGVPMPLELMLRRFFTVNLTLKLVSLGLALVMWAVVVSQRRGEVSELKFTTPLILKNIPANLVVTSSPVETISVLVSLNGARVNSINPSQFQVAIDLGNQLPGPFEYPLSDKNVIYNNAPPPPTVTILQVSPTSVPLVLEETVSVLVPIKPRFSGTMSTGFTLGSIQINPKSAKVRGPRTTMEKLAFVHTRPLDVQDLNNNVEMAVELDLPPSVRLDKDQENFFQAKITVSNNPLRLLLRDVPIAFENPENVYKASTSSVNVFLEGPSEVMGKLNKSNVYAQINMAKYPPGDHRGVAPVLVVPDTVRVIEQWPIVDLYVINRTLKKN